MEQLYQWGLDLIKTVQQVQTPVLTNFVKVITFFGDPLFYLAVLPVLFWCVDTKKGFRIGVAVLLSGAVNSIIKYALCVPRPYLQDPSVGLISEKGFSTPSGHAQGSTTFWGTIFCNFQSFRRGLPAAAVFLLPLLIGFTRVYLGVHYPHDVIFGWILGTIFSAGLYFVMGKMKGVFAGMRPALKILSAAVLVYILNFLGPVDTTLNAALFGFIGGYVLLMKKGFDAAQGTSVQKILRVVLGLAAVGLLYFGLKMLLPVKGSDYYQLGAFFRYGAVGFTVSFIMPKLFIMMRIA